MMNGKRKPNTILTHENWDNDDQVEIKSQSDSATNISTQDEIKNRVIKKAKRKVTNSDAPSVFATFKGFGGSSSTNDTLSNAENVSSTPLFSFGKTSETTSSSTISTSSNTFDFLKNLSNPMSKTTPSNDSTDTTFKVAKTVEKDVSSGIKPTFPSSNAATAAAFSKSSAKWSCPTCMVSNESSSVTCVCCSTANPTTPAAPKKNPTTDKSEVSKSTFSFGFVPDANATHEKSEVGFKFDTKSTFNEKNSKDNEVEYTDEYLSRLRCLNVQVSEWISQHVKDNPSILLTPIFKDYQNHLNDLEKYNSVKDKPNEKAETCVSEDVVAKANKPLTFSFGASDGPASASPFSFGRPCDVSSEADNDNKPKECGGFTGFNFGGSDKTITVDSGISAADNGPKVVGSSKPENKTTPAPTFSFSSSSNEDCTKKPTFSFGSNMSSSSSPFSFGKNATTTCSGSFSFQAPPTFSATTQPQFGVGGSNVNGANAETGENGEGEDEDSPPKVEVVPVSENDSIHSVRCKLFYKKDATFVEKGLGMLHIKPVSEVGDATGNKKFQLLIRAETNLGNILLNISVGGIAKLSQRNNNVQFMCIPNPPLDVGVNSKKSNEAPVLMLVKFKNNELAHKLVDTIINECKVSGT